MLERGCAIPARGLVGKGSGPPPSQDSSAGGSTAFGLGLGGQRTSAQWK